MRQDFEYGPAVQAAFQAHGDAMARMAVVDESECLQMNPSHQLMTVISTDS